MSTLEFRHLIPHQGKMCLLERVLRFDATHIEVSTRTHLDPLNPLRRDGRLRSVHLCEYGAQAMAVHGALLAQAGDRAAAPGVLVSLRDVALTCDYLDNLDDELVVTAETLHNAGGSMQCRFEVRCRGEVIASGRAAVMLRS